MCFGGFMHCINCPENQFVLRRPVYNHPVPLLGAKGTVRVVDTAVEVTVEQRFENKEDQPIEVEYQFRLDSKKVAVTKFVAFIDGKKVKGILKEKEEARNTYDDAIASGHGAYLLEQSSEEMFTASIGNLPPKKQVIVWLTYVMELEFNDAGQLRLVLPEQKFAPDGIETLTFPAPSAQELFNSERTVPAGLTMDVIFEMSSPITQIICESHPDVVKTEIFSGDPRRGSLKMPTTPKPLVVDLEILVQLEDPSKLSAFAQKNDKGDVCAMVSFFPRLMDVDALGEIIFLVDRSGSMQGSKMKRTVETMQIFMRSLSEGVKFNIVSFGSSFSMLFPKSKEYSEASLAEATKHLSTMAANMGGTEILAPLRAIFKQPADPKYPRQLFILTDGEVSDPSSCISECRRNADSTRVFCFGIGSGASKKLVEGMALAANGDFEMIGDSERIDDKVLKQLGKALAPAITNIEVTWPADSTTRVAPFRQVTTFAGSRVTSFAWLKPGQKSVTVKLTAVGPQENVSIEETIQLDKTNSGDYVFALAARRLLKDFKENRSYAHTVAGALAAGWSLQKVKEEETKLSLETGVMCEHTAFVAVEERDDATQGQMVIRKIRQGAPEPTAASPRSWSSSNMMISGSVSMPARPGGGYGAPPSLVLGGMMPPGAPPSPMAYGSMPAGAPPPLAGGGGGRGGMMRKSSMDRSAAPMSSRSGPPMPPPQFQQQAPMPRMAAGAALPPPPAPSAPVSFSSSSSAPMRSSYLMEEEAMHSAPKSKKMDKEKASAPSAPKTSDGDLSRMRETILKQAAAGNWKLEDAAAAVKISVADITAQFESVASQYAKSDKRDVALTVFATALVCAFFETVLAAEKVTWQLVVKKARSWISKAGLSDVQWNVVAQNLLKANK